MELERVTVDRLVVNSHDSSTDSTVDDDEFCWQRDPLAVAKFSKSGVWDKVTEGSALIFGDTQISL